MWCPAPGAAGAPKRDFKRHEAAVRFRIAADLSGAFAPTRVARGKPLEPADLAVVGAGTRKVARNSML